MCLPTSRGSSPPADLPKLEEALALAQRKNLAAYDIMTERYEVTSQLQREFVNDREVFGTLEAGSAQNSVRARSIHHVMKVVAGTPLRRPPWFFDIDEYGEGLADVGTHVVDLVQWTAFPDQAAGLPQGYRNSRGAALAAEDDEGAVHQGHRRVPIFRRRLRVTCTAACWITTAITRWRTRCAASTWSWRFSGTGRPRKAATYTRRASAARNRAWRSGRARLSASFPRSTSPGRMPKSRRRSRSAWGPCRRAGRV